jgi:O-antigen/teichoic acid export membrane protein
MVQVTAPRLSALLARHERREASELVTIVAGWQVAVMWPIYLVVALFPTPLLEVFGDEVVSARGAMTILAITMLFVAPVGPTGAVIMMAGRSRQAMFNSLAGLTINIVGNLIFVPRHGMIAAGAVWAVTILTVEGLTVWQANVSIGVRTFGRPALIAIVNTAATIGVVGVAARLALGDTAAALAVTAVLGGGLYLVGLARVRTPLHLDTWWNGLRGERRPA